MPKYLGRQVKALLTSTSATENRKPSRQATASLPGNAITKCTLSAEAHT
jgi:hypothetical protein